MSSVETNDQNEKFLDLSKNKRATIRKFKNLVLVDIREYYTDSNGESKPGKKGISLTKEQWETLIENRDIINEAVDEIENGRPAKKAKKEENKENKEPETPVKSEVQVKAEESNKEVKLEQKVKKEE